MTRMFYKELKISSYRELAVVFMLVHKSKVNVGIYFDCINTARVFSYSVDDLLSIGIEADVNQSPANTRHVVSYRSWDQDRQSERRRQKKIEYLSNKFGDNFDLSIVKTRLIKPHYFVSIYSTSSGEKFNLCVRNKIVKKNKVGSFSSYGLSVNGATVPFF